MPSSTAFLFLFSLLYCPQHGPRRYFARISVCIHCYNLYPLALPLCFHRPSFLHASLFATHHKKGWRWGKQHGQSALFWHCVRCCQQAVSFACVFNGYFNLQARFYSILDDFFGLLCIKARCPGRYAACLFQRQNALHICLVSNCQAKRIFPWQEGSHK